MNTQRMNLTRKYKVDKEELRSRGHTVLEATHLGMKLCCTKERESDKKKL
jgi:hypothetical protein